MRVVTDLKNISVEEINKEHHSKINLFIDMDGVLAGAITDEKEIYKKGFFEKRPSYELTIETLKTIENLYPSINLFILSKLSNKNLDAEKEKIKWLKTFVSKEYDLELFKDESKWLFVPTDESKISFAKRKVKNFSSCVNILIDDFNPNLYEWSEEENNISLKVINELNNKSEDFNYLFAHPYSLEHILGNIQVINNILDFTNKKLTSK
ncbi:MAG: hypothetical protein HG467_003890 [Clostridiales bacterium]|nr:hypothetical protein [Clostridiales bacterium]